MNVNLTDYHHHKIETKREGKMMLIDNNSDSSLWHPMTVRPRKWRMRVLLSYNGCVIIGRYDRNPSTLKPSYFTGCGWFSPDQFDFWMHIPLPPKIGKL